MAAHEGRGQSYRFVAVTIPPQFGAQSCRREAGDALHLARCVRLIRETGICRERGDRQVVAIERAQRRLRRSTRANSFGVRPRVARKCV
jgi:hypothetical protein